jgi:hypothetical protein
MGKIGMGKHNPTKEELSARVCYRLQPLLELAEGLKWLLRK